MVHGFSGQTWAFCLKIFTENLPEVLNLSLSRGSSCLLEAESSKSCLLNWCFGGDFARICFGRKGEEFSQISSGRERGERERKQKACEGKKEKTSLVVVYWWTGVWCFYEGEYWRMGKRVCLGKEQIKCLSGHFL